MKRLDEYIERQILVEPSPFLASKIMDRLENGGHRRMTIFRQSVAAVATILYHTATGDDRELLIIEPGAEPLNGRYFRQNLGFDDNQIEVFRGANRLFRSRANQIIASIEKNKEQMFAELNSPNPDRTKIDETAAEIGNLHKDLKEATATFYLSLKDCCTEQQKKELTKIFTPLFHNPVSAANPGDGSGNRHRYRHGQRNF